MNLPRCFLAVLACCWAGTQTSLAEDPVLITHPGVTATLTTQEVSQVFLGKMTKWEGGQVVKLAVLASGETHEAAIKRFSGKTADQFSNYWKKQVFTGQGVMPKACDTEEELVAYVTSTPGAVGYVSPAKATAAVRVLPNP